MSEINSEIFLERLNNDIPGNEFTLVVLEEQSFELYRKGKSTLVRFKVQSNLTEEEYYQHLLDIISQSMTYTFHREYNDQHVLCPECGPYHHLVINSIIRTTCIKYVLDLSNQESYVDNNKCVCMSCGNEYVVHDLKSR